VVTIQLQQTLHQAEHPPTAPHHQGPGHRVRCSVTAKVAPANLYGERQALLFPRPQTRREERAGDKSPWRARGETPVRHTSIAEPRKGYPYIQYM
jgi:hypothetical protein